MTFEERLLSLRGLMKSARDDDTRYLIAGALRDLGYIDFQDFCRTSPPSAHIEVIEQAFATRVAL
ncbi:MAG: hypothetical protein C0494_17535 [Sphingobium sp.]|nr:hypothetical protein [Sphingobium sp.]